MNNSGKLSKMTSDETDIVSPLMNEWSTSGETTNSLINFESYDYLLIIDLEATCCDDNSISRSEMEIIEIGAVLVDTRTLKFLSKFTTFIKPVRNPILTDFCTNLTTIKQSDVDIAPHFHEAIKRLKEWLHDIDNYLFCSWGMYDKHQFVQDCKLNNVPYPFSDTHCNIKSRFSQTQGFKKQLGMAKALRRCGIELSGQHHRGIDDAKNMVKLLPYITGDHQVKKVCR